jgi:hypothetical protein
MSKGIVSEAIVCLKHTIYIHFESMEKRLLDNDHQKNRNGEKGST